MKLSLRNLALGAAIMAVGAMSAQEPTVTQKWIYSGDDFGYAGGACRTGNGWGGDVFVANGAMVQKVNGDGVTTVYTHESALNRCITIDEAGNILAMVGWPSGAGSWGEDLRTCDKFILLKKADNYATATPVTINVPAESSYPVDRFDVLARAIGDFTSEEGGLFYIVANKALNPMPVMIANSQGVDLSYTTTAEFGAANTMATAVPSIETMADLEDNDAAMNTFYYRTGGVLGQIGYVDENGEAAYLPVPTDAALASCGADWALQSQNGFDVFTLGEHTYQIRMAGPTVWTNQFVISDETGNIVYHSNYDGEYAINNPGTGNGCNIVARKVSPYKVEIYQAYLTSKTDKCFAAMYEMTIPEGPQPEPEHVYLVGQIQGWNPAEPMEFAYSEGKYTLTYEGDFPQGFKLSTAKGTWDEFHAKGLYSLDKALRTGNTYNLEVGHTMDNMTIPNGNYIFTVDLAAKTLTITGDEVVAPFVAPELLVRGAFNEWGTDAKMTTDGVVVDGYVTYNWSADELTGAFKIGTADWNISLGSYVEGGLTITEAGEYTLDRTVEGGDITADLYKPTFTLKYPAADGAITLTVACETRPAPVVNRNPFAYDVKGALTDNDHYTVTFKSTGAAEEGEIVITDAEGQTVLTPALSNIVAGENTAVVDIAELPEGAYTWAVRLVNTSERENLAVCYEAPAAWANEEAKAWRTTGAAVVINDPEADAYGYTVVGHGYAQGYAVFDPAGNQVVNTENENGLFNVGVTNATNGSSTSRGDDLHGLAVFADWSDSHSGYWVIDPLNPATPLRNMLLVEGATQAGNGTVTYNGVATGSGSPCVAFQGTGDDTKMFAFDEDIYSNTLVRYNIGTNTSVVAAPEMVLSDYAGKMINTNIEICPVENGFFVSQNRADGADANVPGLMYFNNAGQLLFTGENMGMPSFAGGVAVSNDGTMIANAGYDGYIRVSGLTYNEYDEPEFTTFYEFNLPITGTNNRSWTQINFDPANNLHIFNRIGNGYTVVAMPAAVATTPAKAEYVINKTSGIGNIDVENAEAPVHFYNLQGVEVPAENLVPGMYIRRQGNASSKVVIR